MKDCLLVLGIKTNSSSISLHLQFSDICSRASTQGISPYAGQLEDIASNMRWLPKTYALFVIFLSLYLSISVGLHVCMCVCLCGALVSIIAYG